MAFMNPSVLSRTIIFDLLFCLYVLFVEPLVLPELKKIGPYQGYANYWIGILALAALAAELPGVYLKLKAIGEKMLGAGAGAPGGRIGLNGGPFIVVLILHTVIGLLLTMIAFHAFSLDMHGDSGLFAVFWFGFLAREGVIIYFTVTTRVPQGPRPLARAKNILADLCLFFFTMIAYTATWRVVMPSSQSLRDDSPVWTGLTVFFASILFLMFYLPCNMMTFFENFQLARSRKQLLYRLGTLLLVVAAVMYPLVKNPGPGKYTPPRPAPDQKEKLKAEEIKRMEMEKKPGRDGQKQSKPGPSQNR